MSEWIGCRDGFITADIIRWKEAVWDRQRKEQGKGVRIGQRRITAEVVGKSGEWVDLLVRECVEAARFTADRPIEIYNAGEIIRRARNTILKYGNPERLRWSDETARTVLLEEGPPE